VTIFGNLHREPKAEAEAQKQGQALEPSHAPTDTTDALTDKQNGEAIG
jgi:hypothetical protein